MYSSDAGEAVLDGLGENDVHPNFVFTRVLAPKIETPGINLVSMARDIRREVKQMANGIRHSRHPLTTMLCWGTFIFHENRCHLQRLVLIKVF